MAQREVKKRDNSYYNSTSESTSPAGSPCSCRFLDPAPQEKDKEIGFLTDLTDVRAEAFLLGGLENWSVLPLKFLEKVPVSEFMSAEYTTFPFKESNYGSSSVEP